MTFRLSRRGLLSSATLSGVVATTPGFASVAPNPLAVGGLLTENVINPLGVQLNSVRLSWRLQASARNTLQTAYRVQVASSLEKLRAGQFDLWDSGRVASEASFDVTYGGKALTSRQRVYWQVKVWDNHDQIALSEMAYWEMGLLSPSDWTGQWLAAEDEDMRGDRELGLKWLADSRPTKGQTRQVRLAFTLPDDSTTTFLTAANVIYKLAVDGQEIELPYRSPLAWGPRSAEPTVLPLKRGRHMVTLCLDDLDSYQETLDSEIKYALLIRAKQGNRKTIRLDDQAAVTSLEKPQGWQGLAFDDRTWSPSKASKDTHQPFPSNGAFLMRRDFEIKGPVTAARLYVTALGGYETLINGHRVGTDQLAPECTDFNKTVLYRVHDVTDLVQSGANAIGALVGDGWYGSYTSPRGRFAFGNPPLRYIAQLDLTYADGSRETIQTDAKWKTRRSPVTMSEIYDGEDYDARLEQPGWANAGFADTDWQPVTFAPPATGQLTGMITAPIRKTQTLVVKSIRKVGDVYVLDYGQNFAGWVRLKVKGKAGQKVTLKFAEILKADGRVDQANLRAARAAYTYILKGDAKGESYEPHLTYFGFRYVEISGLNAAPTADQVSGIVIHSDLTETAHLRVANPLIAQLWQNTLWSQRSNFMGIPTDCPQRDERLGWMGDAHVFWDAACFNMQTASFTERFTADIRDAQTSSGAYTDTSPDMIRENYNTGASPGWSDAGVILPWTSWKRFGDTAVIDQNWDAMRRYIAFIESNSEGYLWTKKLGTNYGDWLSFDSKFPGDATTPKELIATAMWKHSTDALIDMAKATGRDHADLEALSAKIKGAFIKAYVANDGTISNGSQTGYILALRYDLVPISLRQPAAAKLQENVLRRGHLTTGFLGTPFSLDALADGGYASTVYDLLLRTRYPSWGYMVSKGATTIWERWNGDTGDVAMNSFNHYSLGAVTGFVFRRIAGIDPVDPGFKTFTVNPVVDPRVKTGGADYDSIVGRISTDWSQGPNGAFLLSVTVPANARATIVLPGEGAREGKLPVDRIPSIKVASAAAKSTIVEVGSGTYHFSTHRT